MPGRQAIVDALERQLFGARGKANAQNGDRESIADSFDACFFESPAISRHLSRLNGQLDAAHLADGFEPARQDGYSRGLDPVELVLRACHHWDTSRWPGTNGRLVYAQSLYAVFMLRQLEHLSLRIWDEDRLSSIVMASVERPGGGAPAARSTPSRPAERGRPVCTRAPAGARRAMADSDRARSADQARAAVLHQGRQRVGIVTTRFASRFTRRAPCWPAATCGRSFGTFRGARAGRSTILDCSR